ncbi:MAG TPA: glycosyltransferase family 39 protein [Planctomycetota bacterium]|nr:glycosyltransferase family 39 protein [Planctomycetota bacterium]
MNAASSTLEHEPRGGALKALALLVGVYLVVTCWNLQIQAIANPDEARYASPAREMIRGADWMVPYYNTKPRLVKPIFFYWLIAVTGSVGQAAGIAIDTAMRLGPVIAGLFAVVGTFLLGRAMYSTRAGLIAGLMLSSTYFFHDIARQLVVDMTLTAFSVWANYFAFLALQRVEAKRSPALPLAAYYLAMAFVSLTKGPLLAIVFCMAPPLVFLIWERKLWLLSQAGLLWGLPLFLIVGLSWFIAVHHSGHDMWAFFMRENVGRALGRKDHQRYTPFVFYLLRLGEHFLPWVLLLPFAAWWSWQRKTAGVAFHSTAETASRSRLLACWILVPFIILGIAVSKRALYILPIYPYLALWIAHAWDEGFLSREGQPVARSTVTTIKLLMIAVLGGGVFVAFMLDRFEHLPNEQLAAGLVFLAIAVCGFLAAQHLQRGARFSASLLVLFAGAFLAIGYESVIRPFEEREVDSRNFYAQVREHLNGRHVVVLGHTANEAVWYLDRPKDNIDNLRYPDLKAKFFESPGTVLLVPEKELNKKIIGERSLLKEALIIEGKVQRYKTTYLLAVPNPAVTPDPAIFAPVGKNAAAAAEAAAAAASDED